MYYDGFHRSFCDDDDDLDIIQESDSIFAFETPETFKLEYLRTKRGGKRSFSAGSSPIGSYLLCLPVFFSPRESSGEPQPQQLEVRTRQQQVSVVHAGRHDAAELITH